ALQRLLVPGLGPVPFAERLLRVGQGYAERRIVLECCGRQLGEELLEWRRASLLEQRRTELAQQIRRRIAATRHEEVTHRLLGLAARGERRAGFALDGAPAFGTEPRLDLLAHEAAHEVVAFVRGL